MKSLNPVLVLDLFEPERQQLLQQLAQLDEHEWYKPTICAGWTVKDIALHLLGDDIGILSRKRDKFDLQTVTGEQPNIDSWSELVAYINDLNDLWVRATRRISSHLLLSLLKFTGHETYQYFISRDPYALGESVSWAGPGSAPVWLDIAREYTERWVHQQQIRDAVDKPGLKERRFFAPILDTFVRALPRTFRGVQANNGTLIQLIISGEAGGEWYLLREEPQWILGKDATTNPDASVSIDQETAWRLFTKGISKDEALHKATVKGNQSIGVKVLETVSIIA